ncbi:VOC family protein [Lutibaculum baratangense]|uniref:Lactoylglutathione lyase n=1 Tax=Lutibaculum baratangense AMV1 TaxID=631454 RepID=V4QUN0_9HYPH|nr:VOC family protein [Lutibaculum baratangense]ESR23437.1 Lactoylglutathione lyase [Lutibaculum baratangense AMV1]
MEQRLTLVTLAVDDVAAATAFYGRLGWRSHPSSVAGEISFFQLNGVALALFSRRGFADDTGRGVAAAGAPAATAIALNFPDRASVDTAYEEALAAGAGEVKRPVEAPWGGYSGYYADPDGHLWEVAHNPFWKLAPDGTVDLG